MNFRPIQISDIQKLTSVSVNIELNIPPELMDEFRFKPGQYLTFLFDDKDRRDFSISSSPISGIWSFGVKETSNGFWSKYLNRQAKAGDTLYVSAPNGKFGIPSKPNEKRTLLAFAGGSGITPIISIIEYTLQTEPGVSFHLFYGNKSESDVMYAKRLVKLKKRYPNNFFVHHFFSRQPLDDWFYEGRLNAKKFELIINQLVDIDETDEVLICGPEGMIREIANAAFQAGIPKANIHFELFNVPEQGIFTQKIEEVSNIEEVNVVVELEGDEHTFVWPNNGSTLLEALLAEGLDAPYSCKGGVCSTCMCLVNEGDVVVGENVVLTEDDLKDGLRLACVAKPKTSTLHVSFDEV